VKRNVFRLGSDDLVTFVTNARKKCGCTEARKNTGARSTVVSESGGNCPQFKRSRHSRGGRTSEASLLPIGVLLASFCAVGCWFSLVCRVTGSLSSLRWIKENQRKVTTGLAGASSVPKSGVSVSKSAEAPLDVEATRMRRASRADV
jgi:hypothetical protein